MTISVFVMLRSLHVWGRVCSLYKLGAIFVQMLAVLGVCESWCANCLCIISLLFIIIVQTKVCTVFICMSTKLVSCAKGMGIKYSKSFIHVSCVFYNALRDQAKGTTNTYCLLTVDQHRLLIGRNLPAPPILWARQHRLSPVHHQYSHLICKVFR